MEALTTDMTLIRDLNAEDAANVENKFLSVMSMIFVTVLLCSAVLTWLGIIDLRIVSEIKFDFAVEYIGNFTMFFINLFFLFSICLHIFDKKILIYLLGYVPICVVSGLCGIGQTIIFTAILPIIYLFAISFFLFKNNFRRILIDTVLFNILIITYQQISGFVKLYGMGWQYYKCNIVMMLIYSIDLYLVYILLYRVVKKYDRRKNLVWLLRFLKSNCKEILGNRNAEDVSDLTVRQRRIFSALIWIYLIAQSCFVIGVNLLINKFLYYLGGMYIGLIELIIASIALEIFRRVLGKTFHDKKPLICNAISLIVICTISRFSLPLNVSLFFNVCVSAGMAFIIHVLVVRNEKYNKLNSDKLERDIFNSKSRRKRALSALETLSIEHLDYSLLADYAKGETLDVLAGKHNLSQSTVNRKINVLTRK